MASFSIINASTLCRNKKLWYSKLMRYGINYKGSKNKIAEDIVRVLPTGKRLVDLFGGGAAITHCASVWGKYEEILYNEKNPIICDVVKDAIRGKYRDCKPEWISREEFNRLKDKDGYVAACWSFGGNLRDYFCSHEKEPIEKALHNYVVFGDRSSLVPDEIELHSEDWHTRRLELLKYGRELERLQALERLERLQALEGLERLQFTNNDYSQYEHREGDVVYCDIPYECKYQSRVNYGGFDFERFYKWVLSRDYDVYFSSYDGLDKRLPVSLVWSKNIISQMGKSHNAKRTECLYLNKV